MTTAAHDRHKPKRHKPKRRDAGRARGESIAHSVLLCTLQELAEVGLRELSVERVAQRAQVNKTSVYRRWPTKDALVVAALEGVLSSVSANVPDTGSLRGDLLALIGMVAGFAGEPLGVAVLRAALSEQASSGVAALASRSLVSNTSSPLKHLVARARKRSEWRMGVDAEQLVFTMVGAIIHRALLEHRPMPKVWLEQLVDLLLTGVLPRPTKRRASSPKSGARKAPR